MKKIYSLAIMLLAFVIIISNNSYAGLAETDESSYSTISLESLSSTSESNTGGSTTITAESNKLPITSLNGSIIDKLPKAYIVMISPNPAYEYAITNFIGWIKDPNEPKVSFIWDFGDGEIYSGEGIGTPLWCNTSHKYTSTGDYIVTLSLVKDSKILANSSKSLKVISAPIFAEAGGPYSGLIGEKIVFKGQFNLFSSERIGNSVSYVWDFGDSATGYGQIISHKYSDVGNYIATLTIIDENGNIYSDTATVSIVKITITILPSKPTINEEVNFGVDAYGISPSFYSWDFGDGNFGSGQTVKHIYTVPNTYYGKLFLYNDNEIKCNNLKVDFVVMVGSIISVDNKKPVSFFTASSIVGDTSTVIEFDAKSSIDTDGEIVLYEWYFGDGNVVITKDEKYKYVFNREGNFKVTCVVVDNDGAFDTYTKEIKIQTNNGYTDDVDLDDNLDGLLFTSGVLKKFNNEDSQIHNINEERICDFEISVSGIPKTFIAGDPLKIQVNIVDKSKLYIENDVDILLSSNLQGYENVKYSANKKQGSNEYYLDIQIPTLPENIVSADFALTVNPKNGYTDSDWSGNTWSNVISEKIADNPVDSLKNIEYTSVFGSLSM